MGLDERDVRAVKMSVPVWVMDVFELREDLEKFEDVANRLEKVVEALLELYRSERVKNWELILKEMLDRKGIKKEGKTFIKPIFKVDTSEVCPSEFEEG